MMIRKTPFTLQIRRSVANPYAKIFFLGGLALLPVASSCGPTITSGHGGAELYINREVSLSTLLGRMLAMRRMMMQAGLVALVAVGVWLLTSNPTSAADDKAKAGDTVLVHNVFFALKDASPAAKQKLVDACKKYLTKHEGEVFFTVGVLTDELKREVNDRDFDVALHIVFTGKAAHDKYQDHERHTQFITENKDNWKKVRVFDSTCSK
jgi:hypothetical protein